MRLTHFITQTLKHAYAPYEVMDTYGTSQFTWTYAQAHDWLRYTSPHGFIFNRYTNRLVASRTYHAAQG